MRTLAEVLEVYGDGTVRMNGFDDCLAGVVLRFGQDPILCYDHSKLIAKLMSEGMTEEEAEEHFEFNQLGAWVGDRTPCFLVGFTD